LGFRQFDRVGRRWWRRWGFRARIVARLAQLDHLGLHEVALHDQRLLRPAVGGLHGPEDRAVEGGRDQQAGEAPARPAPHAVSSSRHIYSRGSVTIPSLSTPACFTAAMTLTTSP
jgi:hypothetical protein